MAYALALFHYQNVYPAYMYVHIPCDCQSLFFYWSIVLFSFEHWSQCLYPPPSAMVLPLAHRMMHLLTVLSLSQGCVYLVKISSKILDGVYCKFSFYFLNALIVRGGGGDKYKVLLRIYTRIKPAHVDTLRRHIDSSLTLMSKHTWYITSYIISCKQLQLLQLIPNILRAAKVSHPGWNLLSGLLLGTSLRTGEFSFPCHGSFCIGWIWLHNSLWLRFFKWYF